MTQGYPRLVGDIGGTHARWGWQEHAGAPVSSISVLPCTNFPDIVASARHYLQAQGLGQPRWAGLGVATPVTGDQVRMTNHHWAFSIAALQRELGVQRCRVVNDFTALALSLPALGPQDLMALGGGAPVAGSTIAVLGPGTGLGVSGLVPCAGSGYVALAGEGGHVTLAATDDGQAEVLAHLRRTYGHVSAERVLSGAGLVELYRVACALAGVAPRACTPADVGEAAALGDDAQCQQAVRWFTAFLGNVAGNLALTLGALGGVYVGGGIVPKLGHAFDAALFRQHFEAKGRYHDYLAGIPAWVITAATPALLGASRALDIAV